jgi:hypothetical protein
MEPEVPLLYLPDPTTDSYHEPDASTTPLPTLFPWDPF